jgi:hypothetical protein
MDKIVSALSSLFYTYFSFKQGDKMSKKDDFTKKTQEISNMEEVTKKELKLMKEFNDTKVEPLGFVRKTLLGYEECLSYL